MTAITSRPSTVVHQGQHICLLYEDPQDQLPTLLPYIQEGLQRGEQCIYIVDDIEGEFLRDSLRRGGLNVASAEHEGALLLWTRAEWRQPGRLDSARKSAQVASILKRARTAGFAGVRLAVEMTWTLNPQIPVERLRHWEATLDTMVPAGQSVSVICMYSRRRLAPALVEAGLRTHPLAIVDGELHENPYFAGPAILSGGSARAARATDATQLRRMISRVQRKNAGADRESRVREDVGTGPVPRPSFLDVASAESAPVDAISGVSHELRTPVSTILGNAELLARLNGSLPEDERVASVTAILAEARRLTEVLDDLFVLWQDIGPLAVEPVALNHTINRHLAIHRRRHPARAVDFAPESTEAAVAADQGYVLQILSDLLDNAERFSPPGERILIETALEGEHVAVRIVDQGPDVEAEERDLVFKPFLPAVVGLRRGSGAGLAASKRLVEAHGGRIWTQPSAKGGTEFGFTLPIASEGGSDGQ